MITFNLIWSKIKESERKKYARNLIEMKSWFETHKSETSLVDSKIAKKTEKKKFKIISALFHEKKCDYVGQRQGYFRDFMLV